MPSHLENTGEFRIMKWISTLAVVLVFAAMAQAEIHPAHDKEFWRGIAKNKYAVPPGEQVYPLLRELSAYLGSPDPVLRDDLGYSITEAWIIGQKLLSPVELNTLTDEWRANLNKRDDSAGGQSVLLRSFSALSLVLMAERDRKDPFLGEARYRALLDDAVSYLHSERDLRGFDTKLGWIHATAHTADLLAVLAENPLLRKEDQGRILNAVSERLSSAHEIFSFGEQDRLGVTVVEIVKRRDFDKNGFIQWLAAMDAADAQVWKDVPPKLDLLQTFENNSYMLRALAARLSGDGIAGDVAEARNAVTNSLRQR